MDDKIPHLWIRDNCWCYIAMREPHPERTVCDVTIRPYVHIVSNLRCIEIRQARERGIGEKLKMNKTFFGCEGREREEFTQEVRAELNFTNDEMI